MDTSRFKKWKHFTITESLPGSAWGTGGTGLGDFTGNGIMDVAVSRRETRTAYWFERQSLDPTRHRSIGSSDEHARRSRTRYRPRRLAGHCIYSRVVQESR